MTQQSAPGHVSGENVTHKDAVQPSAHHGTIHNAGQSSLSSSPSTGERVKVWHRNVFRTPSASAHRRCLCCNKGGPREHHSHTQAGETSLMPLRGEIEELYG